MSQNPYSQFGSPGSQQIGGGGDFVDPASSRTSGFAVTGLVVAIIGCIACIVPGTGAIAAMLGGLGVFFIARSGGRLTGTGIGITAIVLGLFHSVAWIALATGLAQANATVGKQFFGPVGQMMNAIENGDMKGSRALLSKEAAAAVTDDMLRDFARRYHASTGAFKKTPDNVYETVKMFFQLVGTAKKQNRQGTTFNQSGGEPVIPLPAEFEKGSAFVMIVWDPRTMGKNARRPGGVPPMINVGVATLTGDVVWLMDPEDVRKLVLPRPAGTPTSPHPAALPGTSSPPSPPSEAPQAPLTPSAPPTP